MALANVPHIRLSKPELAFLAVHDSPVEADLVTAIAWAEQGGEVWTNQYRPEYLNPLGGQDNGIMSINDKAWASLLTLLGWPNLNLFDPLINLDVARRIRSNPKVGWGPWAYGPLSYRKPPRSDVEINRADAALAVASPVNPYWRMYDAGMDVHDLPVPPKGTFVDELPPPPLKFGNQGPYVHQLQVVLVALGLFPGVTDDYFGPRLRGDYPQNPEGGVREVQRRLTTCGLWFGPTDGIYSVQLHSIWSGARRYIYLERGR